MAKRKKKKNRGPKAPPLSFLDRCIYYLGYFLLFCGLLVFLVSPFLLFDRYCFSDPNVIAAAENASCLLLIPFTLYVILSGFIGLSMCYSDKKPFFGNQNVNYKDPKWKRVSPLFSKKKVQSHIEQRPSHIRLRKKLWRIWLIGLIIVTILVPFGFFGRQTYDCYGIFHEYNCVNQETASYTVDEVESLSISIYKRHKTAIHGISLTYCMEDGQKFSFDVGDFQGEAAERLDAMLQMKSAIPAEKISYEKLYRMDRLLDRYRSDPQCIELVKKIFDFQEGSEAAP